MTPGFQAPLFLLLLASLQLQASSSTTTPGQHSGTSPTQVPPGHGAITAASTTPRGPEPPAISVFSLSFSIENRHFNSSLEDPGSSYYQELQRNISELFWQIYKKEGFLGLFNIKFRYRSGAGSVVVESTLAFRKGATDARSVQTQLEENKKEFAAYHLFISNVRVWVWGTWLGHCSAGAGLCPGGTRHHLCHCSDGVSVPPKELWAAGHLSSPRCLSPYERVSHLPHPRALHASRQQTQPL
uniref:Mucin-1 n=1 Tax=Neovison vison TaxID=452646 RepID=A0A8C7BWI6_NEOVI